jgi:hypothetical protein
VIEYSDHAEDGIRKRKISKKLIREAVLEPDEVLDSFRGRKLRRKTFGGKMLEVVTITEGKKTIVVTQYYLDKEDES